MKVLDAAFAHPRGLLGQLGGAIMARATGQRNEWTLSLLDIRPGDRILEVGCGPGALIQALAARATEGLVVGIDPSPTMLRQASKRNAQAIREGRVRLEQGSATALPFEEASFDKALSANSLPFWPDQEAGLREMWRVLRPGGIIAIILQPRWARTESEVKQIGEGLVSLLSQVGFQQARLEFKPMKPIGQCLCAWHQVSSAPRTLARPDPSPLAGLVFALSSLLEGKAPVEREGASSSSYKLVFERGLRKGREGQGLLHGLGFDEAEVIDPHAPAGLQHAVEFAQGLREFRPVVHTDGRHHHVKGLVGVG